MGEKMKKMVHLSLFLFIGISNLVFGIDNTSAKKISAVRLTEKISVDGILSEDVWKRPGFTELWQQEPSQGEKPSQQTEVWVAYDDDAIYYAAKYYDTSPHSILARLSVVILYGEIHQMVQSFILIPMVIKKRIFFLC
jgi:hypothetical protein